MPARFREVFFYAGVDERTAAGNVGIIVPLKGSNVVMLDDGLALSTVSPVVQVDEITDPHYHTALANLQHPMQGIDIAHAMSMLKTGVYRAFKITGNSLAGIDVAKVLATNTRTSRAEATLKVLVVEQKLIKISIRPAQVRDDQGNVARFTNAPFDAQGLVDQMNSIWKPQANIVLAGQDRSGCDRR